MKENLQRVDFYLLKTTIEYDNYAFIRDSVMVLSTDEPQSNTFLKSLHKSLSFSNRKILIVQNLKIENLNNNAGNLNIAILRNSCDGIVFYNCEIGNDLVFNLRNISIFSISIIDTIIKGKTYFLNQDLGDILIYNSQILKGVQISASNTSGNIVIDKSVIHEGDVEVKNSTKVEKFELLNHVSKIGGILINDSQIQNILIRKTDIEGNLTLKGNKILIDNLKVNTLNFDSEIGEIKVSNLKLKRWNFFPSTIIGLLEITKTIEFSEGINFKGTFQSLVFNNAIFKGNAILLDEVTRLSQLLISSSQIPNFIIKKSKIDNITIEKNSVVRDFHIQQNEINNLKLKDVKVTKNIFISDTSISIHLSITDTIISEEFSIYNCFTNKDKEGGGFEIEKLIVRDFKISNSTFNGLTIMYLITKRFCTFSAITVYSDFQFSDSLQAYGLQINEGCKLKNLSLYNCKTTNLKIEKGSIESNRVEFIACLMDVFTPSEYSKFEYFFVACQLNYVYFIERTNPKDVIFTFIGCSIGILQLSHFNNLGNLFLRDIQAAEIIHSNSERKELIRRIESENFEEILDHSEDYVFFENHGYSESTLILNQSSLGKAEFTNCDFDNFHFFYNNTKLTETFISGGRMPQSIDIQGVEENKNPDEYYNQKVAVYNQLKKIFDNQGDIFQSSFYQAKASENQARLLKHKSGINIEYIKTQSHNILKTKSLIVKEKLLSPNAWERLTFWLNEISNNHGESWSRALKFTLFSGLLTFVLYLFSNKYLLDVSIILHPSKIQWNIDWKFIKDNFHYFFDFLNPTHKSDLIKEAKNPSAWSGLWDLLGRISIGYGIFQLISAFRKHSKK